MADTEGLVERFKTSAKARRKGRKKVEKKVQVLERLNVEYVQTADLKPNSYNPNRQSEHDFELLLRSMEEDGFTQPIVVGNDSVIVDGEHRWRAAQALELKEIPIVRVDMNEAQARVATIRHNRARGSHDIELEAEVLRDLQRLGALDWAADSLMLDDEELNKLLEDVAAPEALAEEDFSDAWVPDKGNEAVSQAAMTGETQESQAQDGSTQVVSMSADAIERQRELERKLAQARTDEERKSAKKDADIYRLNVIFSGDEGAMVRKALGGTPAAALLEMCRAKVEAMKEGEAA